MLQTPPNSTTARIQASPDTLSGQMKYMERRYDDVLGKVLEQNALILKSVSRMQDDLKKLRSKLESLEMSAQEESTTTGNNNKVNGVDGVNSRLNETNLLLQGQQIGGSGILNSPASVVGSSLSAAALTSPFQQPPGPYYNPYPPMYNPYMMMPMSDPMAYFVNPTMQYAAMYAALGQHTTSPVAPPQTTELPKVTPPPFSFGVQLPVTEESPVSNKSTTSSIFSQPPKASPVVSNVLVNKAVEPKKDDKSLTQPDFAAASSKMSSFGDLSKLAPSSTASTVPLFSFGIAPSTQPTFPSLSTPTAPVASTTTTSVTKSPATSTSTDVVDNLNENLLFQHRAKLLRYVKQTKEWKESEIGDIKILQSKEDVKKLRVIMRCEKLNKVVCNHWVTKDFEFTNYQEQPKTLMWSALDADLEEGPKIGIFVCKFGQEEQAKEFKKIIDSAMSSISQPSTTVTLDKATKIFESKKEEAKPLKSLSEIFKVPEGQWNCTACYSPNNKDSISCVACTSPKPGCTSTPSSQGTTTVTELPKSTPFSFGFKLPTSSEESPTNKLTTTSSIFSQTPTNSPVLSKLLNDKGADTKKDETTVAAPDFAALSSKMCGFGDLTKSTPPPTTTTTNSTNLFSFGTGSIQPIFSSSFTPSSTLNSSASKSPANNSTHADEDTVEEFEPTVEFAPVIPLPPLVEVKKGDENENVLFQHRAKLLRYVKETKEWKERGIGDIKILQSKEDSKKIRVVMWREKVHKVVCNHWVTKDFAFTNYQEHSKSLMWTALDFAESEEGPKTEIFVCRFGQEEQTKEFKKQIEFAVSIVSQSPTSTPEKAAATKTSKPDTDECTLLKPFSELFKIPDGQWNCAACYTANDKDKVACVACASPKPGCISTTPTSSSQETDLPQHNPPCRGCDPDSFDFSALDGRQVPTFEDLPKPQRPSDSVDSEKAL